MVTKLGGGEVIVKQANSSPVQNSENILQNPTLESDFSALKEVFYIDEVGVIRLSKLVPDHTDNEEIFSGEFKRKIDFYKNFLGVDIRVNITENELFAGYKKVSIDIDGKHNTQVWNHILKNILPDLEKTGFKKSFISLEILRDLPKEVLDDYMKLVSADFVLEKGNIIKDIVLWLENALATKYSKEKGIGDISEIIRGNNDLEHLMMMIAHVSKMDNEFKETLELLYIKLVRYKDPKVQGLLRFLGHNVDKNVSEKKLIDKARSRFSISVAKLLGGFGGAKKIEEKRGYGEMDWTTPQVLVSPETNLSNQLALGHITIEEYNRERKRLFSSQEEYKLISTEFVNGNAIDLRSMFYGIEFLSFSKNGKIIRGKEILNYLKKYKAKITLLDIFTDKTGFLDEGEYKIAFKTTKGTLYILKFKVKTGYNEFLIFSPELKKVFSEDQIESEIRFVIDTSQTDEYGRVAFPKKYIIENGFNLDVFGGVGISQIVLKNENKTILEKAFKQENFEIIFQNLSHGDYTVEIYLENQDKYLLSFHCDPDYFVKSFDFSDIIIKQIAGIQRTGEFIGYPVGFNLSQKTSQIISTQVSKEVIELLSQFNGIESLEDAFLNRKTFDIKSVFPQNISKFLSGKMFFDKNGQLHIEAKINKEEIFGNSYFSSLVGLLINGEFDDENLTISKEGIDYGDFLDFIKDIQSKLTHYIERGSNNGVVELLLNNIDLFKNNESKRRELLEIIFACMQENNKNLKDFYRELGKVDKEFRKLYVFHTVSKVEKVQVLKTLIERNNLSIVDVWGYLSGSLKLKFFSSFKELFDYEIEEKRFNELLAGVLKELNYLLGDDIVDIKKVFDDLFGDDNYLALEEEIRDISEENIIKKDLKEFFIACLEKRKKQIEDTKEKIEKRKKEITDFIQKSTKEKNKIVGFIFDYNFDEKGYTTGNITFKVETFSYGGNPLPKLKFILEGGLSNKLYFKEVDLIGLQEAIGNWEAYNSFRNYELLEEDFISYFDSKTDEELQPYISDVQRFLNGNDRRYTFKDKEFAKKFLERCYSLDEKFLPELIVFELSEAKTFEDLIRVKRTIGDFDGGRGISFVPRELNKIIEDDLLDALKKLDFVRVGYYLQLDDEGENFLQELQKQDFNSSNGLLKFTQKYRGKGIIISKICTIIDNYIVVKPKTKKSLDDGFYDETYKELIDDSEKIIKNKIYTKFIDKEIFNIIKNDKY